MQALLMILSALFFASMGVCVKLASTNFNSSELVFYRGLIGVLMMAAYARWQGTSLRTRYPAMHAWRSVVGVLSLSAWFYSLAHLPLPTAMTLNYMSSIWIAVFLVGGALLGAVGLQGKPASGSSPVLPATGGTLPGQGPLVLAILASFAGVVMLLRPAIDQNQAFAGLIGLLSGLSAAFAYMQVMAIGRLGEPEARTVFYFAIGTVIVGAFGMLVEGMSPWNWSAAVWLLPIGILASLGQFAMTKSFSMSKNHGSTLMVANLQYCGIVFAALYSTVFFGDHIPLMGWAGILLIVASAIGATVMRARAAPSAPAEEH
ncbi:MAG: DMT family transporter [Comamonadaceae bacterium]|nr:MAG: DMT family transporter [Comamonadaceae bacterium]